MGTKIGQMQQDGGGVPKPPRPPRLPFGQRLALGLGRLFAGLFAGLALTAVVLGLGLGISGGALPVPHFAIAQVLARVNANVAASLPGSRLHIAGISVSLGPNLAPQMLLQGVQLRNLAGRTVMELPQLAAVLAPRPLLNGNLVLREVRLSGAEVRVTRDANGTLDIAFAAGAGVDLAAIFALTDQFFASALGREMGLLQVDGLRLGLRDQRLGRSWSLGNGTLVATRSGGDLAVQIDLALAGGADGAGEAGFGRAALSLRRSSGSSAVQMSAQLTDVFARDLAAQAPPLAFLSVLDAPISGLIRADVTPQGLGALSARLELGAGALAPNTAPPNAAPPNAATAATAPIRFSSAYLDMGYEAEKGRILLNELRVVSEVIDLRAGGEAAILRGDGSVMNGPYKGEVPAHFDVKLRLDTLRVARPEIFVRPVEIGAGSADLRLNLAPFSVDVTHIALSDAETHITASGSLAAKDDGWQSALKVQLDQITSGKLLGLWPKALLKGTRDWLDQNLLAARFSDLRLSLTQTAGQKPVLDLAYHFDNLRLTPMRSLPAITGGAGYGAITGRAFSLVLQQGQAAPPLGGALNLAGSVFTIPDINVFPATGQLTLQSHGSLTATLSLLDQRPFQFLTKSNRKVDFAQGTARLTSRIELPLKKIVTLPDVAFQVTGEVRDFASDTLVSGKEVRAPKLAVLVNAKGLRISGAGQISGVEFDAAFGQDFGPQAKGQSRVTGHVQLSDAGLRTFGLRLPEGMITGKGRGDVTISLARGQAGRLVLTSDLVGIGLAIDPIGFAKPAKKQGTLRAAITLSGPPQITELRLLAGDLAATGTVRLSSSGLLDQAAFSDLTIGKWFAGMATFRGPAQGQPLRLDVPSGTVDLRYFSAGRRGSSGAGGLPLALRLERLRISDAMTLVGFQGDFRAQGGLEGSFVAQVAGGTPIQGRLTPSRYGTAVQISAQDAGAALAQAGIYADARGGALDLRLTPLPQAGQYQGALQIAQVRVQNNSVLADLLNGISVIGLLEQLGGPGILFGEVSGDFLLTPQGVDLREGVAIGASLGVTMQGVYRFAGRVLDMQGVITPIYLLNGVGAVISKRGEGVLGFNYRLRGNADAPQVGVNPLSVLLPGFLRNIFKAPPATLEGSPP